VEKVRKTVVKKELIVVLVLVSSWITWNRWLLELTYPDNIRGWRTLPRQVSLPRVVLDSLQNTVLLVSLETISDLVPGLDSLLTDGLTVFSCQSTWH